MTDKKDYKVIAIPEKKKTNRVTLNYLGVVVEVSSDTETLQTVAECADVFALKMTKMHKDTEKKRMETGTGIR